VEIASLYRIFTRIQSVILLYLFFFK